MRHVLVDRRAVSRLEELELDVELIERVIRRADAEASMCTELDPPIMEGMTRWGRTTRFLREELVARGWSYDNPRNLARTIHPSGEFALVAATGDEFTGVPDVQPSTKYRKGEATVAAVSLNVQLAFDFPELEAAGVDDGDGDHPLLTWFLLFYPDEHEFRAEVSLPDGIMDGRISSWAERIIMPVYPRGPEPLFRDVPLAPEHVVVEVSRR
ncbi:MAG TPA: hypothetical protein VKU39_02040 [Streptosporangiaceae bacterium]|nr:hypothetical protein [Streptosporangiaceae bacterium]